jgi:hypothetical protein
VAESVVDILLSLQIQLKFLELSLHQEMMEIPDTATTTVPVREDLALEGALVVQ